MVIYGITLSPLAEELFASVTDLLAPFYTENATFNAPADRRTRLMTLLLERGMAKGYFPDPTKSLFICDSTAQEDTEKQACDAEGLRVNVMPGR